MAEEKETIIEEETKEECLHPVYEMHPFSKGKELRTCMVCGKEGVWPILCGKCSKPKKTDPLEKDVEYCNCGRPPIYSEEMIQKALDYIESCEDEEETQTIGMSAKGTELFKTKVRVNIPSAAGLALHLGVVKDTLYAWAREYPEFSVIIGKLMSKQEKRLVDKGLSGDYNPTIAKLILSKHGYRDSVDNFNREIPIDPAAKAAADGAIDEFLSTKK